MGSRTESIANGWSIFSKQVSLDSESAELVLDVESGLENFLTQAGWAAVVLALATILADFSLWPGVLILILVAALCGMLRRQLADTYRISTVDRSVVFERRFSGWSWSWRVCPASSIRAVLLHPHRESTKNRVWWEYGLSLMLQNGKLLPVLSKQEVDHREVVRDGKKLAGFCGVPFQHGKLEQCLCVRRKGGQSVVTYEPPWQATSVSPFVAVVAVVAFTVVIVVLPIFLFTP